MWVDYISAMTPEQALQALADAGPKARIVAGATDLILELERGVRKGVETVIDISRIPGLDRIELDEDGLIHLGPLVTHNHCASSKLIREKAYPLARAAWEVGAPQIRNRATVAGNLITASPANDTITPLMALDAQITLKSTRSTRVIPLREFYTGVRKTVMQPDEMLVDIAFKGLASTQRGTFVKVALRRAQAISIANLAILLTLESGVINEAVITLGAVAPTIIRAPQAEAFLVGKELSDEVIAHGAELTMQAAQPIDDLRSSADYRREMVRVFSQRALRSLRDAAGPADMPADPVTLAGAPASVAPEARSADASGASHHSAGSIIRTRINGRPYEFSSGFGKTLLRLLREEAGLTGTKEGCAEGECGACTVFLDGMAVMACMVPAPRAHGAEIVTVEGLASGESLHPVQEAFVSDGAVQCGYCTPGFLMSAAKLLEQRPHPTKYEIEQAITGNLCRCTGYYKIVQAIEDASNLKARS